MQKSEETSEELSSLEEARSLLNRWQRRAIVLGIALFASVASDVPFLEGYFLHAQFHRFGRPLLVLSGCLLTALMFSAGQAYNFWVYHRDLKKAYGRGSGDT
jgi:hypothetical protein